jgi:hypothetical protein
MMWLPEDWRELRHGAPGRRFREHHARRRTVHGACVHRLTLAGGVALMGLGLALVVTPGPGIVLLGAGAAVLAAESAAAAHLLDALELRLRASLRRLINLKGRLRRRA